MKYNMKEIMTAAWKNFRKYAISFAEALHRAWISAKAAPVNAARIEAAKAEAGVTEETHTWYEWKEMGLEVVHGMKCLFQTVIIYGSKGDGATYKASFFGKSQVAPVEA